jgi:hypothetical protein
MIIIPELIVQQYISKGFENLRTNLWIIPYIFSQFNEGILKKNFGINYILKIKKFIEDNNIPVLSNFVNDKQKYPCIIVKLKNINEVIETSPLGRIVIPLTNYNEKLFKLEKIIIEEYNDENGECKIKNRELLIFKGSELLDEKQNVSYFVSSIITTEEGFKKFTIKNKQTNEIVKFPSKELFLYLISPSASLEVLGVTQECEIDINILTNGDSHELNWIKYLIFYILKDSEIAMADEGLLDSIINFSPIEKKQDVFPNLIIESNLIFSCKYLQKIPKIKKIEPKNIKFDLLLSRQQ